VALKSDKARGKSGILPDMLKCCGAKILEHLAELLSQVWREGRVSQDWRDAVILPIPKKGDLSITDNWRGISLLNVR